MLSKREQADLDVSKALEVDHDQQQNTELDTHITALTKENTNV